MRHSPFSPSPSPHAVPPHPDGPPVRSRRTRLGRAVALLALMLAAAGGCRDATPLTGPLRAPGDAPRAANAPSGCGRLLPDESLTPGQTVTSCNGAATLVLQEDLNVVLYDAAGASWSPPNTIGRGTTALRMQADGNLVASNAQNQALWTSGTYGHSGAWLAIQDDCNLVVYSGPFPSGGTVLWESNTPCRAVPPATGHMLPGDQLWRDVPFTSGTGNVKLVVQSDQNVVLYQGSVPLWSAPGTAGSGTNRLIMQYDGNLVAVNRAGQPTWASGTAGNPGAWLQLQDDCNLVIYRGPYPQGNGALWATGTPCRSTGGGSTITPGVRGDDYLYKNDPAVFDRYGCDADKWSFCKRNCTSFVAWRLNQVNGIAFNNAYRGVHWGNASNWGAAARSVGIPVDMSPRAGDVAWWSSNHVAWVAAVNSDGTVLIEEYNRDLQGNYNSPPRTISASSPSGYIHMN